MPSTTYMAHAVINYFLRGQSVTAPTTLYLALYTTEPQKNGSGTEVSGAGYAREEITFASPSNGITLASEVVYSEAGESWGEIGYYAIFDHATSGNMWVSGAFNTPKTIGEGDTARVPENLLTIEVD